MKLLLLTAVVSLLSTAAAFAKDTPPEAHFPAGIRHEAWDALLQKYVNEQGLVAYRDWKANAADSKALDDYLGQFAPKPEKAAEGDDLVASAINAYNAFAIRWILSNYPTDSIQGTVDPFANRRHDVGGEKVALDWIEHGTLRPKIGWRAHAALVCCARSCPPLQRSAYVPEKVLAQIDAAYTAWLVRADLNRFKPGKMEADVSPIFKWFAKDFENGGGLPTILSTYAPEPARMFLKSGDAKIDFLKYNWGLNDQSGEGKGYGRGDFLWDQLTGTFKKSE